MAAIEKLIVAQLVNKFAAFFASRFFHCLVYWSLLSAAYTCTPFFIIHINIILPFYVSVCGLFVNGFATECSLLLSPLYSVLRRISLVIVCDVFGN